MKSAFSETDPKYQCCCGSTTIKIGANIVGILEVASVVIGFLAVVIVIFGPLGAQLEANNGAAARALVFIAASIGLAMKLATAIILLIGIKRESPTLLLLWLIKAGIFLGIVVIVSFATLNFTGIIGIFLEVWFFYIVFCCRDYFIEKAKANQNFEWDSGPGITTVTDQYNTFATEVGIDNPNKIDLQD